MTATLQDQLNEANPNTLAEGLRLIQLGNVFRRHLFQTRRHIDMTAQAVNPYQLTTVQTFALPDDAKASVLQKAVARAGTSTAGILTVDAQKAAAPATLHVSISPNGDIVALGSDAWTDLDVEYLPEAGDIVDIILPCASNACTLPTSITKRGVIYLTQAESLVGTLVSKLKILMPADSPSTGQCALTSAAKAGVTFASADAVTRVRLRLLVAESVGINSTLDGSAVSP